MGECYDLQYQFGLRFKTFGVGSLSCVSRGDSMLTRGPGPNFRAATCWMARGPLPVEWVSIQTSSRGLWGQALRDEMEKCNTKSDSKWPEKCCRTSESRDSGRQGSVRAACRVTYSWADNDKA